ncbi:unnamed protein product [Meloidogyne enterolobii]|uniref:Uncharacterized protein n=1 Tax=Meloidogyne enterolobii TaxID=390850 RepID=A0ACB0YX43_MELEN
MYQKYQIRSSSKRWFVIRLFKSIKIFFLISSGFQFLFKKSSKKYATSKNKNTNNIFFKK